MKLDRKNERSTSSDHDEDSNALASCSMVERTMLEPESTKVSSKWAPVALVRPNVVTVRPEDQRPAFAAQLTDQLHIFFII